MKASELFARIGARCFEPGADPGITAAFTSDLLSDVMGNAPEESVLITIQAHATTVAVSLVADIRAILLCSSREAPPDMLAAAAKEGVAVYGTPMHQFDASVAVHAALGLPPPALAPAP